MFKTVLLPVDLSDEHSWKKALPAALETLEKGGVLHVIAVLPDVGTTMVGSYFEEGYLKKALNEAGEKLKSWIADNVGDDVEAHPHIVSGRIYAEIIHAADAVSADLIVIGSHQPDLADYLLGPNAARVVRHARQSVLVVRE